MNVSLRENLFYSLSKRQDVEESEEEPDIVVDPSQEEENFVRSQFEASKPSGRKIERIYRISNQAINNRFLNHLNEKENEEELPQSSEERIHVIKIWKELVFSPSGTHHKIALLWHGTTKERGSSICTKGFQTFGKPKVFDIDYLIEDDSESYGRGIYFSDSAKGAVLDGKECLVLSLINMQNPYPVVSNEPHPKKCSDVEMLEKKGPYKNYNAYFIPVSKTMPNTPSSKQFLPCYKNQTPDWNECVIFDESQTAPCFIVQLEADLKDINSREFTFDRGYEAAKAGNLELLQKWIQEDKMRLYMQNDRGENFCFSAVIGDQLPTLQWLYKQDNSLIKITRHDRISLMDVAAMTGANKIFTWLAKFNNLKNQNYGDYLSKTAFYDKIANFQPFLRDCSIIPSLIPKLAGMPCEISLKFLLENGYGTGFKDRNNNTLLHIAALNGQTGNIELLLDYGTPIDDVNSQGETALYVAASAGHYSAFCFLLARGADPLISTLKGNTHFHTVVSGGHTLLLKKMLTVLELECLLDAPNEFGETPLHLALQGNPKEDCVKLLLGKDVNFAAVNKALLTPLHYAAMHGHLESLQLLILKGAISCVETGDFDLFTPMHFAAMHGHLECAKHLFQGGGDPNAKTACQQTPLDLAISYDHDHFVLPFLQEIIDDDLEKFFEIDKECCQLIQQKRWVKAARKLNEALQMLEEKDSEIYEYFITKLNKIQILALESCKSKISPTKSTFSGEPKKIGKRMMRSRSLQGIQEAEIAQKEQSKSLPNSPNASPRRISSKTIQEDNSLHTENSRDTTPLRRRQVSHGIEERQLPKRAIDLISSTLTQRKATDSVVCDEGIALAIFEDALQPVKIDEIKPIVPKSLSLPIRRLSRNTSPLVSPVSSRNNSPVSKPRNDGVIRLPSEDIMHMKGARKKLKYIFDGALEDLKQKNSSHEIVLSCLSLQYRNFFGELIQGTQELLGPFSGKWTCVAFSDSEKQEICPFSPLAYGFLVEEKTKNATDYFTSLSKLIKLKLVSLGQMEFFLKSPILIDTPKNLAYENEPFWKELKGGNVFISSCLLVGENALSFQYNEYVKNILNTSDGFFGIGGTPLRERLALYLLKNHLQLDSHQDIYQSFKTILGYLSLALGVKYTNELEFIRLLEQKNILSSQGSETLRKAFLNAVLLQFTNELCLDEKITQTLTAFHECTRKYVESKDNSVFKTFYTDH